MRSIREQECQKLLCSSLYLDLIHVIQPQYIFSDQAIPFHEILARFRVRRQHIGGFAMRAKKEVGDEIGDAISEVLTNHGPYI